MFSRNVLRSLPSLPRTPTTSRCLRQPFPRQKPSSISRRFESGFPPPPPPPRRPDKILPPRGRPEKKIYTRYDPEEARRAKPLITVEAVRNAATSRSTKTVVIIAAGSAVIFYFTHLEEVPVSGRKRFMCYSDASVEEQGRVLYNMVMQEAGRAILPSWDPRVRMVNRVMKRLIPASGLEHVDWEVHVIESNEANAFVIPGGKVFVFSGLLPITRTEDGLATVLGHEIAHNLARHQAEQMSRAAYMMGPLQIVFLILDYSGFTYGLGRLLGTYLLDLGISRPASRIQESEADYIGLMMMARSCYDPRAAVGVWKRMEAADKNKIPEWLSTHPSNENRVSRITEWLPKAEEARSESDCAAMLAYNQEFQSALGNYGGFFGIR